MSERAWPAWVTLATNDSYALGALVLARSLHRVNAAGKLVVMITPGVTESMRETLSTEFDEVAGVNVLDSEDSANLALLSRPELGITFTKLHCWKLTQYSKCVFLDADTLVLQNCDELLDREEFSAAPDVGWPDCFNSGVFVFKPSLDTYNQLLAFAVSSGSFDGGDQGLLNLYFNDWSVSDISRHLPFIYNMVASATYSYLPAFKIFGANVKIVHFIGSEKPWLMYFDSATRTVRAPSGQEHLQELLQAWWDIFRADVHRKLTPQMGGDDNLSATMVEQVQDTFSHIYIPIDPSASYNSPFSSNYEYQPPPTPSYEPPIQTSEPSVPEFFWTSVAIQRQPPENLYRPPPPPPAGSSVSYPESLTVPNPQDQGDHQSSPQSPVEGTGQFVHKEKSDSEVLSSNDERKAELEGNKSESKKSTAGLAGAFAKMTLEGEKSSDQIGFEEQMRKHAWEQGHIDYLGKDSFDNIMKKIQASIAQTSTDTERPAVKSPSPPKTTEVPPPETTVAPVQTPSVSIQTAPQEAEDARLATERQALEKKLADQKRIAEQRLQEEKQAAEARAAAASAVQKTAASVVQKTAAPSPATAVAPPTTPSAAAASSVPNVPVAPPRRQSKVQEPTGGAQGLWRNAGVRVGVGLSCVAVVAFAIYSASASAVTSSFGESIIDDREHENHANMS